MNSTGIVRKADNLGRIIIPIEVRGILDITKHTPVKIYTEGDAIILKKHEPNCLFCGNGDSLISYKGKHICISCLKDLGEKNE